MKNNWLRQAVSEFGDKNSVSGTSTSSVTGYMAGSVTGTSTGSVTGLF